MLDLIQLGNNPLYPKKAILWEWMKDPSVPEWLSDRAKVEIDESGNIKLVLRNTDLGVEVLDSSGQYVIASMINGKGGGLLYSRDFPIMYLSDKQIELLYKTKPFKN